jgi:hypothetical protein
MCSVCADRAYGPLEPRGSDMIGVEGPPTSRLVDKFLSYVSGQIRSVRVTDMRRSGALTLDMDRVAVTLQGDDGAPVSTEVGVVPFRMRSGSVFLHLRALWSALKSFGCMHAGLCWRCTGPFLVRGKVRRARHRSSGSRRRGSTAGQFRAAMGARWRVALSSQPSLRRSEALVRQHC